MCAEREAVIAKEISAIKERLPGLHCNNEKGAVRATPHPAKFLTCERRPLGVAGPYRAIVSNKKVVASVVKGAEVHTKLLAKLGRIFHVELALEA